MTAILASLIGLPRWAKALGALALAGAAFLIWLNFFHDRAVIAGHEAGVTKAVTATAAAADKAAGAAIDDAKTRLEQDNAKAREAAARHPDDPLRAGLDSLRANKGPAKPASR